MDYLHFRLSMIYHTLILLTVHKNGLPQGHPYIQILRELFQIDKHIPLFVFVSKRDYKDYSNYLRYI